MLGSGGMLRPLPVSPRETALPKWTSFPLSRVAEDLSEMEALRLPVESGKDLVSSESWSKDQWATTSAARREEEARRTPPRKQEARRIAKGRESFMVGTSGDG